MFLFNFIYKTFLIYILILIYYNKNVIINIQGGVQVVHKIVIYKDKNGKSEIKQYITELRNKNNKDSRIKFDKIISYIRVLQDEGLSIGEPYIKHLDDEIWELRPLRDRILFASMCNNKFILLSIFMKQTQKTPKKEIEKAKRLLEDYKKRSGENE